MSTRARTPSSNLEARLTGTNVGAGGYQYLGNLNAGTEGSVDFDLVPDAAGVVSGTITLSYEDAAGEPRTRHQGFFHHGRGDGNGPRYDGPRYDGGHPRRTARHAGVGLGA